MPPISNNLHEQLSQFIAEKILKQPSRTIQENEPIITSGLIDSFSLVDLALFVEERFGVHIDDTELNAETFNNIHELVKIIEKRQNT
jgi:acyl carrier protein